MLRHERYYHSTDDRDREVPESTEKQTPLPLGGGGGTFGATMLSRIEDVIHGMDPIEAADTGGVGNEPADLNPISDIPSREPKGQ